MCVSVDYCSSLKMSNLNAAHAHLTVFASARTMGADLQLELEALHDDEEPAPRKSCRVQNEARHRGGWKVHERKGENKFGTVGMR